MPGMCAQQAGVQRWLMPGNCLSVQATISFAKLLISTAPFSHHKGIKSHHHLIDLKQLISGFITRLFVTKRRTVSWIPSRTRRCSSDMKKKSSQEENALPKASARSSRNWDLMALCGKNRCKIHQYKSLLQSDRWQHQRVRGRALFEHFFGLPAAAVVC